MPLIPFIPSIYDASRNNYRILADFLKRVSYKPGWNISITKEQNDFAFIVCVTYEGYESENATDTPLSGYSEKAAAVGARLLGKTFRKTERRYFSRRFDILTLDRMAPEDVIKYVIADTIKQAEMFEFERWFKVDGDRMFRE